MDKSISFGQRILTYLVCFFFTVQPVMAKVVVNNNQHNTSTNQAGNGVEVVNIATPNDKGLSHNQYHQFNVDSGGLILNNSTEALAQSQLGGLIKGNPNLKGQSASVILNEVTGATRSQLKGYTEVFGGKANVILTNPYGITCNGCGFINTPRVTLSTGKPELDKGKVSGFDVSEGSVTIEGLGLDATNQTYFDIISRTAQINANIHANDLTIITGKNQVSYQTNQITEKEGTSSEKSSLAIDSSSLGGMYAGRIALIATENGVGVNVGNLSASQGRIEISADGKVILGQATSAKALTVSTSGTTVLNTKQYAGTSMAVNAGSIDVERSTIAAAQDVSLSTDGSISIAQSTVLSGVQADGTSNSMGNTNVRAASTVLSESQLGARQGVSVIGEQLSVDGRSQVNGNDVTLTQTRSIDSSGSIQARDSLDASTEILKLSGQSKSEARNVELNSAKAAVGGQVTAGQQLLVSSTDTLQIKDSAKLTATNKLELNAPTLEQQGDVLTSGTLSLSTTRAELGGNTIGGDIRVIARELVQSSGDLSADDSLFIESATAALSNIASGGDLSINTESASLDGVLQAGSNARLTSRNAFFVDESSQLLIKDSLLLSTPQFDNRGSIQSGFLTDIQSDEMTNIGEVLSAGGMSVETNRLSQRGTLAANDDISLTLNGSLENAGDIQSGGDIQISAIGANVENEGNIVADGVLTLSAVELLNSGVIHTNSGIIVDSDAVHSSGELRSQKSINLDVSGDFTNDGLVISGKELWLNAMTVQNTQQMEAQSDIEIAADSLTQKGRLIAGNNTLLQVVDVLTNSGDIASGSTQSIRARTFDNVGTLGAMEDLAIKADSLTQSGNISTGGEVLLEATHSLTNTGRIDSEKSVRFIADSIDNQGAVSSKNDVVFDTSSLSHSGVINSLGKASITSSGSALFNGNIIADGGLEVTASDVDNQATLSTKGEAFFTVTGRVVNQQDGVISGQSTVLSAEEVTNEGQLQALDSLGLTTQSLLNSGTLAAGGKMNLTANVYDNAGLVSARDDLSLKATNLTNSGDLSSLADLTVDIGKRLDNQGQVQSGQAMNLAVVDTFHNEGRISAQSNLALNTKVFEQDGETATNGDLQITANESFANNGTLISTGQQTLTSKTVSNHGDIRAKDALHIDAKDIEQYGVVGADSLLVINATESILNQGMIEAGQSLELTSVELDNQGQLNSQSDASVLTTRLRHSGDINVMGRADIVVEDSASINGDISANDGLSVTAQSISNTATLASLGDTTLSASQGFNNAKTGRVSGNNTNLNAGWVTNYGQLQALTHLGLTAASLNNVGALVALDDLTLSTTGNVTNRGLIYAGLDSLLHVQGGLTNQQADIYVGRNLTIDGGPGGKAQAVRNISGSIEANGALKIFANTIENTRIDVDTKTTTVPAQSAPEELSKATALLSSEEECTESNGGHGHTSCRTYYTFAGFSETRTLEQTKTDVVINGSASRLVSGSDMTLIAGTLVNNASLIASNANLRINAGTLNNSAYRASAQTTYAHYDIPSFTTSDRDAKATAQRVIETTNTQGTLYNSSIIASGNLSLNVAKRVNNGTVGQSGKTAINRSNSGYQSTDAANSSLNGAGDVTFRTIDTAVQNTDSASVEQHTMTSLDLNGVNAASVAGIAAPQIQLPSGNAIPFPDYVIPTNPNGLFILSPEPQPKYLIETNPALTDLGNFLGSEYFQDQLDVDFDGQTPFLGDAFYDTRIINQAIFEQTGQRYLNKTVGNDLAQMQLLIDNAAHAQSELGLEAGIALSADQIANLTRDIVWYETIYVDGQPVLAPKLYIASVTQEHLVNGALIAGNQVEISADSLDNRQATISANNDVAIVTKGDVTNLSGRIAGGDVSLVSIEGSVINQTEVKRVDIDDVYIHTDIAREASIQAKNELNITAGENIFNRGGVLTANGTATLAAQGDIVSLSLENTKHQEALKIEKGNWKTSRITETQTDYQDSKIQSAGDLTLIAGGSLTAKGGELSSESALTVRVGENLTLVANETHQLSATDAGYKKDTVSKSRQVGTALRAGENLDIAVGGDATLIAADVSAGQDIFVTTGGDLNALSAEQSDYERHYLKSSSIWGDDISDVESKSTSAKGTTFVSGGNLAIHTAGNQTHQASELVSNQDITLTSDGRLHFEAAEESEFYRQDKTSSGLMVKSKGKGQTSTTQKMTEMRSGGDITLAGALGIQVDYVSKGGGLARALNQLPADGTHAWMAALKDNPNVDWNEVNEAFDSWSYSDSHLSGPAAAIIAIAVTVVTAGAAAGAGAAIAGGAGVAGTTAGTTVAAMGTAAASSLMTQATLAVINNQGDIGGALKDLGSSDTARLMATAIVTAGALASFNVMTGVTDGTLDPNSGLPNYSTVDTGHLAAGNPSIFPASGNFSPDALLNQIGKSGIQAGVDSAINGSDFTDGFLASLRSVMANNIGAIAAGKIGDLGIEYDMANGSFSKSILHGLSQGAIAELAGGEFAAGAAAGVAVELAGNELDSHDLEKSTQVEIAGLIGAGAGVLATGKAEGAYTGQNAGEIVHQFNHLNHTEAMELVKAEQRCQNGNEACQRAEALRRLDTVRNTELLAACNSGNTAKCSELSQFALDNRNSYREIAAGLRQSGTNNYQMSSELAEHFLSTEQIASDPTGRHVETANRVMNGLIDFTPGVGDIKGFAEAQDGFDYLLASVGLVPVIGDMVKDAGKAFKAGDIELAQDLLTQAQKALAAEPKLLEYKPQIADNVQRTGGTDKSVGDLAQAPPPVSVKGEVTKGADKLPIYDTRTLKRMAEDAFHNFPTSFEKSILSQKPIVRSNGRSEFLQQGTINGKEGVFHITTDKGGKVMRHRAFIPKSDWARYSKRWELPQIDEVAK